MLAYAGRKCVSQQFCDQDHYARSGRGMRCLSIETHSGVSLVPVSKAPQSRIPFAWGAYLRNGDSLPSVMLRRNYGVSARAPCVRADRSLPGAHVYGGVLFHHFGHFLLESLARCWALQRCPDLPVVWHVIGKPVVTRWQREIFKLLQVDPARFVLVSEPAEVEQLHIPEAGYQIQNWAHPTLIEALARFPFRTPRPGYRLWLSRSRLSEEAGNVIDMEALEHRLETEGWQIAHPQEHSIAAQLEMMADAEVVGGLAGSALHTLVLGRDTRCRVAVVPRDNHLSENFNTIARAKGLHQCVVPVQLEHLRGQGPRAQTRLSSIEPLVASLRNA